MIIWIVGSGGLLGSALVRVARNQNHTVLMSHNVPWSDPNGTVEAIARDARHLEESIERSPESQPRWAIIWAAGRATTASSNRETEIELSTYQRCLEVIEEVLRDRPAGVFALASSAGGVYAGSSDPPFNSSTEPRPLGTYGQLKLSQERAATQVLGYSIGVLIARIANLYGPGQDITKLQGLISQLALTSVTKEPLTMFVPLDTLRDYVTSDDAAARVLHWITANQGGAEVRVIASGQATSLGYLINLMKDISRVATPIASGVHESAAYQSADLRLRPDTDDGIASMLLTPLPAGLKGVYQDILLRSMYGNRPTNV